MLDTEALDPRDTTEKARGANALVANTTEAAIRKGRIDRIMIALGREFYETRMRGSSYGGGAAPHMLKCLALSK